MNDLEERAKTFGFPHEDRHRAVRTIEALNAPDDTLDVAMDLARFVRIPLADAVWALHSPRDIRRLGIEVEPTATSAQVIEVVRPVVAGMASAYTRTLALALQVER